MNSIVARLGRWLTWLFVGLLVILAIAVTTLRIMLPRLSHFQGEIQKWVNQQSEMEFTITDVRGFWRNTHPSLSLQEMTAQLPNNSGVRFTTGRLDVEFDLIHSLLEWQPVVANLTVQNLNLDIRSVDWTQLDSGPSRDETRNQAQGDVVRRLDDLLLRQLGEFSVVDSTIHYQSFSGDFRQLDIEKLRWSNNDRRHKAEGIVSITDEHDSRFNGLSVSADFRDHGSLLDVSGDFYLGVDKQRISPWLTQYLRQETGIEKGQLSLNAWLSVKHNQPTDGYLELKPSELSWSEGTQKHDLIVESGIVRLYPRNKGWNVNAYSLKLRTDDRPWPDLDAALEWHPGQWRLNLSRLDIQTLTPLAKLIPDSGSVNTFLRQIQPEGYADDIRVSMDNSLSSLRYSATLTDGGIAQWELLPEVHHLKASVAGNFDKAVIRAQLSEEVLPYGDVFQAPLNIRQGDVDLVWQRQNDGWSLWSDNVSVESPDLKAIGEFRLDFPDQKSPMLAFYAEADLNNAGETWRYLPTRALGQDLTDYLSSAIQGGRVNTAKLIWYGELGDFPYRDHNGVFQAQVGLRNAKFSFDTAWPPITDLQLDLLFENDAMYLDSDEATLMNVKAQRITGRIPELAEDGHIEIEAKAVASGHAVRDYMTATPLVDSVGAALTALQVNGNVKSEFQLNIPFNGDEARAWGWADLKGNKVEVDAPPMTLTSVSGRVNFDNDVVRASGLKGTLLEQPISINFKGQNASKGYSVRIDTAADWDIRPLTPYVGKRWLSRLSGHGPWSMGIDLKLNDIGFTYQIDAQADLKRVASQYPAPLLKAAGTPGKARLQASGNQETITARLQLPEARYQAEINIRGDKPELTATNLVLGKGNFKVSPIVGHHAQVRLDNWNLDQWLDVINDEQVDSSASQPGNELIEIPLPERVDLNVKDLTLATFEWHNVDFTARKKSHVWHMILNSSEAKGQGEYNQNGSLSVELQKLHLYVPQMDENPSQQPLMVETKSRGEPLVSDFDRTFHTNMPNLTLKIEDFWLQGYKVGVLDANLVRDGDTLRWTKLNASSGSNQIISSGSWRLHGKQSHTQVNIAAKGDNNSELMERFGISSGIQKALFELKSDTEWDGAPWSMKVDTLQGTIKTDLGKGMISNVSGAARLLGMFSLDSIIRRMQLDFSDVFDKGMAFNSIKGSGKITDGVFLIDNLKMDAIAGEMTIKGLANLNMRMVDAEVNFIPDITSGIPVLSAFAVTPQTAFYVLAITTVISPVVEVFTQVNYEVKGPFESPTVKEMSRRKGELKLPKSLKKLTE